MAEEGPASGAEAAFLERAYPAETISARRQRPLRAAAFSASKGRPFPAGKGKKGTWVSVGPSQALYPVDAVPELVQLRADGRTSRAGARRRSRSADSCKPGDCRLYITPAGRRHLAHEERADRPAELGVPRRAARDQRRRRGHDRPERRVRRHDLRRHRRGEHLRLRLRRGRRHLQVDRTVATRGPARSAALPPTPGIRSPARASARSSSSPASPNTIYVGTTTALRGMSEVCCSGVTRPVPGAAKWGLYKSTNGGATWSFIHNGADDAADCTGDAAEFANAGVCSPRGVRDVELDPIEPGDRLRRRRTRAASGARRTAARRGRRSSRRSTRRSSRRGRDRRHDAAERQDADVRVRGQHRQPRTRGSSAATTSPPVRPCSPT